MAPVLTPSEVSRYTMGECWSLALALQEILDSGLVVIGYRRSDGVEVHVHAAAMTDGRYLDVEGFWTPEAWYDRWEDAAWSQFDSDVHDLAAEGEVIDGEIVVREVEDTSSTYWCFPTETDEEARALARQIVVA